MTDKIFSLIDKITTPKWYGIFATVIFLLTLFPYTSIVRTPFDTQPWALMTSFIFFIIVIIKEKKISIPKPLIILLVVVFYAGLIGAICIITEKSYILGAARIFASYVSVFTLAFIGYRTFNYVNIKVYFIAIGAWFLALLSQFIFGASIISSFLPRISTDNYRGFTSLAPEPALYASFCIALLILNELFYKKEKYNYKLYLGVFLILILQIIFTYSGVGMMTLALFAGAKFIQLVFFKEVKKEKIISSFMIVVVILSFGLFFKPHSFIVGNKYIEGKTPSSLSETRAGYLIKELLRNPLSLVHKDLSMSRRVINPVLSLYAGIVKTHGLGMGLAVNNEDPMPLWLSSLLGEVRTFGAFGGKAEGGLSGTIYELGVMGLLFTCTILWIVFKSIKNNKKMRSALLVSAFTLFIPMFMFGPIAFPLFGYILGIHLYYLYNKE